MVRSVAAWVAGPVELAVDHPEYRHSVTLSDDKECPFFLLINKKKKSFGAGFFHFLIGETEVTGRTNTWFISGSVFLHCEEFGMIFSE